MDADLTDLIKKIHDSPSQAVLYATGGGMQASVLLHKRQPVF